MSFPKLLLLVGILLFTSIGIAALFKGSKEKLPTENIANGPVEVELDKEIVGAIPLVSSSKKSAPEISNVESKSNKISVKLPEANRIEELFNKNDPKLPIVETIVYKSRVPWQKGRPAWLSDYASYYATSRHFIARSLNGKPDYLKQDIAEGDRFNVLRKDRNIEFYLLIDLSRYKLWLYYLDMATKELTLLKTYNVGLGRIAPTKTSGFLTPIGKYTLGSRVGIYKPKIMGMHNGEKIEMIRVFGTRWIPFEKEISGCSAPAKGFGLHGVPWIPNEKGELIQNKNSLGKSDSDGCIRLATEDMEEIFAIIITKPTTVELVKDFHDAKLPGSSQQ
jgi:L,D-transpeptidase catalytic domain